MTIDRRYFLAAGAASVAAMALPATVARALDGPVAFAKDSLIPDWLNLSDKPAWFGVDVVVSPRGPDELADVWLTRFFGEKAGSGFSFLTSMTTREIAAEREEPLAIYTVAPVRPLQLGECMAYLKEYTTSIYEITSNAIWTGSPEHVWSCRPNSRYQHNSGRKYEGIQEFDWIA